MCLIVLTWSANSLRLRAPWAFRAERAPSFVWSDRSLSIYLSIHLSIYCIYLFGSADYSITKTCNGEESETPWTMRLSVLTGSLFLLPKANIWGTVEEKD